MDFDLSIAFTNEQLQTLFATGTNVILAKPAPGGNKPNVAWLVFRPLNANTVNWTEDYGIYASTQSAVSSGTLTKLSSVPLPAIAGKLYTLSPSGALTGPGTATDEPTSFSVLNQYGDGSTPPYMTVGLFQDATVNGTKILQNAISAAPVIYQSTAAITPFTTVYIWLASQVKGNSVVTSITSKMTELRFGGTITSLNIQFDSSTGTFIPASGNETLRVIHPEL
jgi:hypothetical protein